MTEPKKRKIKWSHQCKICKLANSDKDQDLWIEVHDRILKDGYKKASVCRWLNSQIEVRNVDRDEDEKLSPFSEQNFSLHFKKHIDNYAHQKYLLKQKALSHDSKNDQALGLPDEGVTFVQEYLDNLDQDFTDYGALTKMIAGLEEKLWRYDEYIQERDQKNPNRPPNITEIENFRKQVESLMDLKTKLSTLRKSSSVAGNAVKTAVQYSVGSFMEIMMEATQESLDVLTTELPGSSLPVEAIKLIRNKVAEAMKSLVPGVVSQVYKDYKIR